MFRLFNDHSIRESILLPDFWNLKVEGKGEFKIPVPCAVESIPALSSYKGKCTLETEKRLSGDFRLVFKGVSHTANVYLDGENLGSHYGAYGEFSFILKNLEDSLHKIKVEADNSYSENSALHIDNDYYSYLGITRPLYLERINKCYIKHLHIKPYLKDNCWNLKISASLVNICDRDLKFELKLCLNESDSTLDNSINEIILPFEIKANEESIIETEIKCENVKVYNPETPDMYFIHGVILEEGKAIDDLIERFGFKEVKVIGKDILYNGNKLILKGFCRHEDYAEFGSAIPLQAMMRDIMLIKDTGANAIRTSHYPNDERFLDLCDELGILIWEEGHARGLSEKDMQNPNFMPQSKLSITEMINNHFNHPSIFVWGLLNECASLTDFGRECYKELIGLIRSLDSSRPVTFASCWLGRDKCLDLVDIVSFNIYPKWYEDEPVEDYLNKVLNFANENGGENKPFIVSEIGAGAIYGYRSNTNVRWTEEFQAEALEEQITAVLENKETNGVFIWQFADCRVDEGFAMRRPKTQNNKGIVDIYRREKLSYKVVKEKFNKY